MEMLAPNSPAEIRGAVGVIASAWNRHQEGIPGSRPAPNAEWDHATAFLIMSLGEERSQISARSTGLATYLSAVSEHGMNASTFTARVVASTGASAQAAVCAAIGALEGPLHGGAPGPVLEMLDAIGEESNIEPWLRGELAAGRRIMGMGHRVYRVRDPRARLLEMASQVLAAEGVGGARLALARTVEKTAQRLLLEKKPDRPMAANVEFATATLLEAIKIPRAAFSAVFACARTAGWLAHIAEQRARGRIIRPRARYIGATL